MRSMQCVCAVLCVRVGLRGELIVGARSDKSGDEDPKCVCVLQYSNYNRHCMIWFSRMKIRCVSQLPVQVFWVEEECSASF